MDSTIERARNGTQLSTLADALVDEEISLEDAEGFVQELVDNQLLVSELRPPVTGDDSLDAMIDRLAQYPVASEVRACLQRVREDLNRLDCQGLGQSPSRYEEIARQLEQLPAKVRRPRLFQVDMFKRCEQATLGQPVLDELSDGLRLLSKLAPKNGHDQFEQFRLDFVRRYGDRSVPLVQVLDEESGIGFLTSNDPAAMQAPLLRGIAIPSRAEHFESWSRKHAFLYNKLTQAFASGAKTLDLKEQDIDAMQVDDPASLPDAVAVMGTLIAESPAQVDNGDFQFLLSSVSGPSGARLLGRFCHGDSQLNHHVQQHLQQEESNFPNAVVAEVVHLPEGRVGNVLSRPSLRSYEIPFLGTSGAPQESQIDIQDLFVSVEGGEVVLRSERLGRRVIPRLTSAHNFVSRSLCIYKFLCALQEQQAVSSICWNWGPLESCEFLPRVTLGRLVLARAQWTVSREELIKLSRNSGKELFVVVQSWRNFRGFPRHVVLKDGDNELPIDLENILSVETFVNLVKDRGSLTLVEMFPESPSCIGSDEDRFAHEMIIPFVRKREQRQTTVAPQRAADVVPVARRFPPGSDWQYFNLFAGDSTADQLLVQCIGPVARECLRTGACDQWHFIRYNDPQSHLRVRFHGNASRLSDEVAPRLQAALQPYLDSDLVWKIQQDTYEREIERYGGNEAILIAERLFHADSEGTLDLLDMCVGDAGQDTRWKMTLVGMHQMLVDLGIDLNARLQVAKSVRDSFFGGV